MMKEKVSDLIIEVACFSFYLFMNLTLFYFVKISKEKGKTTPKTIKRLISM